MVNIERLKKVREFIAKLPAQACDMTEWTSLAAINPETGAIVPHDERSRYCGMKDIPFLMMKEKGFRCGSVACIGGWTELMANEGTQNEVLMRPPDGGFISAAEYLSMSQQEEHDLFYDYDNSAPPVEGWKTWMLARLDECITAKCIIPWNDFDCDDEEEETEEE